MDSSGTNWSTNGGLLEPRFRAGVNSVVIKGKLILSGGSGSAGRLTFVAMAIPDALAATVECDEDEESG